jgi:hypothetical protein
MLKRSYRHVACEQRCQIQTLLSTGKTQREIAGETKDESVLPSDVTT